MGSTFPHPLPLNSHILVSMENPSLPVNFFVPCLTCVPMGAKFAAALAQLVSLFVLSRANRASLSSHPLSKSNYVRFLAHGDFVQLPHIDDLNSIGTSSDGFNGATLQISIALNEVGLSTEQKKAIVAQYEKPIETLGLWWCQVGVLTLNPSTFYILVSVSELVLRRQFFPARIVSNYGIVDLSLFYATSSALSLLQRIQLHSIRPTRQVMSSSSGPLHRSQHGS